MQYLSFFISFNLYIIFPIIVFGLIFHFFSIKSSSNLMSIGWWAYLIFACIGTPIHELSHYIMCLIFKFKINEVKLFRPFKGKKDGILGYVSYSYNKKNLYQKIGNFFVGIAPMIGGSFVIYILFRLLMNPLYINLKTLENVTFNTIFSLIINTNYNILHLIIFILLTISIAIHMSISSSDLKNTIYGVFWMELILLITSIIFFLINKNVISYLKIFNVIILLVFFIGLIANILTFIITSIFKK